MRGKAEPAAHGAEERASARRASTARRGRRAEPAPARTRRRRRGATGSPDVRAEILRLGGRRGERLLTQLLEAGDAYAHDRERVVVRILQPVRDTIPDSPSVRELLGLALYRLARYGAAAKELTEYARLGAAVDQHPVLMDCFRALRRYRRVDELWQELAAASPTAALVTEGRIVLAGSLADRGRLDEAIAVLERRVGPVKRPGEHHLRLWYALADLEDRAGNAPRARELFRRIEAHDRAFADVAERLAALR